MDWSTCLADVGGGEKVATLNCLPIIFQNLINVALIFAGITAVVLVIISGIKLITSSGDAKQAEGARHTLTYAILGLLIILLSFFIINFISTFTGVPCIKGFGFDNCQ